jgi:cell division inhibitor SepF
MAKEGLWKRFVTYLGFGPEEEYEDEQEEAVARDDWQEIKRSGRDRTNVVPIANAPQKTSGSAFKVLVVEPRSFEEVQTIADQLRLRRPVILNLESLDKDLAQKILNFLNGAIYALGGETQRVANGIFFFAPQGVDVATMGRGLTGTAIGGGAVDLPAGIPGITAPPYGGTVATDRDEERAVRESLLKPAVERGKAPIAEEKPRFDWRNK